MNEITLTKCLEIIILQAKRKGWNDTDNWTFRKLHNEIAELDEAIQLEKTPTEIAEEGIDVIYMLMQIIHNHCPNIDLDKIFMEKWTANEFKKKKTFNEVTQSIVRK